ncbi:hypothetical protein MMC17_004710 [Xylographa soralifera]|nr:hypothetical protein [Xylographa soralifera]
MSGLPQNWRASPWGSKQSGRPSTTQGGTAAQEGEAASGVTNVTRQSTVGPPTRTVNPIVPVVPLVPRTFPPKNVPSTKGPLNSSGNAPPINPRTNQSTAVRFQPSAMRAAQTVAGAPSNQQGRAQNPFTTTQSQVTATPAFRSHPVDAFTPASHRGGRKRNLGPQSDRHYNRQQYEVGMIIIAPLHEAHFNDKMAAKSIAAGDQSTTQSRFGPVYHKARPMIVVTMHEDHYVAVPCFTYRGKGIGARNPDDHVSMHDYRSQGPTPQQTKHLALEIEYMYDRTEIFDPTSVAHFAYPICRPYSGKCERIGYLRRDSAFRLTELYRQTIPPPPLIKAADDAKELKITKEKENVAIMTQTAKTLADTLARKEKTTPAVTQLVQPLKATLKAKEDQVDALEKLLSAYSI